MEKTIKRLSKRKLFTSNSTLQFCDKPLMETYLIDIGENTSSDLMIIRFSQTLLVEIIPYVENDEIMIDLCKFILMARS